MVLIQITVIFVFSTGFGDDKLYWEGYDGCLNVPS